MRQIVTKLSQRGQVTVPVEVQRLLGVGPRERVAFTIENGEVRLTRPRFTIESIAGSVKLPGPPRDIEDILHEAKEERAQHIMEKKMRNR